MWQLRQKYLNSIDETDYGLPNLRNYFKDLREKKKEMRESEDLLKAFESRNFITNK